MIAVRVNAAEETELKSRAARAGISPSTYLRHVALDAPLPRQRSRPPAEVQVLSRLLGQVGKIGSNLNQIAHRMNAAQTVSPLDIMFVKNMNDDFIKLRTAILKAMGRAS